MKTPANFSKWAKRIQHASVAALFVCAYGMSIVTPFIATSPALAATKEIICHAVPGQGQTGAGYSIVDVDTQSAHIPNHVYNNDGSLRDHPDFIVSVEDGSTPDEQTAKCLQMDPDIPRTPAAVTFTDPCGTVNDKINIPYSDYAKYTLGSTTYTTAQTIPATGSVTVTATPKTYTFTFRGVTYNLPYSFAQGATTSWSHTFTNTPCVGSLTVNKVTTPADTTATFGITVKNAANDTVSAPGDTISPAAPKTYTNLPVGSYTVTETVPEGWRQVSGCSTIAVTEGGTATCTLTNSQNGRLIVQKTTLPAGDQTAFPVTVSATSGEIIGTASGSVTDTTDASFDVTDGTYSVTENAVTGWQQTDTTCSDVTVAPGETKYCTITNTKLGSIEIVKTAIPNAAQDFAFTATGTGVTGFSLDDDSDPTLSNAKTFTGLLPGTYSFTETATPGWDFDNIACSGATVTKNGATVTVALTAGQNAKCTYTNRMHGRLVVQKTTNPTGDQTSFSTTASSTDGGQVFGGATKNVTDATDATYEIQQSKAYNVTETVPTGWQQISNTCTGKRVDGSTPLVNGVPTVTCEIVNAKLTSISGTKWNDRNGDGKWQTDTEEPLEGWMIVLTGTDTNGAAVNLSQLTAGANGSYSFGNLLPGTYTIVEQMTNDQAAWWEQTSTNPSAINLAGSAVTGVNFGNQGFGTLEIRKKVVSPAGFTDTGVFDLKVDGTTKKEDARNGDTTTAIRVPAGTHTFAEIAGNASTDLANYDSEFACGPSVNDPKLGALGTTGQINVNAGDQIVCTFTNTRKTGTLKVVKNVVDNYGGTATPADFKYTIENDAIAAPDAEKAFVSGGTTYILPVGTDFDVSETAIKAGYTQTGTQGCTGTVTVAAQTCTITNTATQPELKVVKLVDNRNTSLDGKPADFTMNVDATNPTKGSFPGSATGTTIGLNQGSFSGVTEESEGYTITTDPGDKEADYLATYSGCNESITVGEAKTTCTITNTAILQPGIKVVKNANRDVAHEGDTVVYTFTVTNTGNTPLSDITVSDDKIPAADIKYTFGDDGDNVLELGETWTFTATYKVPAGVTAVNNTATVKGADEDGTTATDDDSHELDVTHPAFTVVKTGPAEARPGQTVTYTFTVTNTGDTDLGITEFIDSIAGEAEYVSGDANSDEMLNPGEIWVAKATYTIPANAVSGSEIKNIVKVCAIDMTEEELCQSDDHITKVFVPLVLGDVAPAPTPTPDYPRQVLAETGTSVWLAIFSALGLTGLAVWLNRKQSTAGTR